jgi:transcriptional regulator with XRE-family HTH domain
MNFAQRLKQTRLERGFSQSELGEKVGVHYTQIGRYEKGSVPASDVLAKMANSLNVSTDFLMSGSLEDSAKEMITDRELLAQFKRLETMPTPNKQIVKELIEAFLLKTELQQKLLL